MTLSTLGTPQPIELPNTIHKIEVKFKPSV